MLRDEILEATMTVYRKKGIKFTMDDLAKEMSRSKKTIYTVFRDKKHLFLEEVDYFFDKIKARENEVLNDDHFSGVDFPSIYTFRDKYPAVYKRIAERLESGWEVTFSLMDKGAEEGSLKKVDKELFRIIYNAAVEKFLFSTELTDHKIHYTDALKGVTDMLIDGISI